MGLRAYVDSIALVDNHVHAIEPLPADLTPEVYAGFFTEGTGSDHARHTMFYYAVLDFLAEYFDGGSEAELVDQRAAVDHDSFARDLLDRANVSHFLQDTGVPAGSSTAAIARHTEADVRPILRIETAVEDLIEDSDGFDEFEAAFDRTLYEAIDDGHVAFKSIAAYRTGLHLADPSRAEAADAYRRVSTDWPGRFEDPTLLAYTAHRAATVAAEADVPLQFHTGFGDRDAHPRYVDPSYLWGFLDAHEDTTVVLLHASYPYARVAGYIVSVLDNVYLDVGMTVPFVQHGVEPLLARVLELAPTTKLLYSSDGLIVPEWHYLAANRMRSALANVLEDLVERGFVGEATARTVAKNVLRENAKRIYPI